MHATAPYSEKFEKISGQTLFKKLSAENQLEIQNLAHRYLFTLQELKLIIEFLIDTQMWQEKSVLAVWREQENQKSLPVPEFKKMAFAKVQEHVAHLRSQKKSYQQDFDPQFKPQAKAIVTESSPQTKIVGQCPVASSKTVCCNLYTIDAVKNCGFSCSYCSIQTMFENKAVVFDADFKEKLNSIVIDPQRFYHYGTGQSSDALMWGNRNGTLEALIQFAEKHPNILLEFKTKSRNVDYFLSHKIPSNVVCSWSLNPPIVIEKEEHLTSSLQDRLAAAKKVAQQGIRVSFHFHPMFFYENWEADYQEIFSEILLQFEPEQIAFVSFGTLTFPKPVINQIRRYNYNTKILQMPLVPNPEGKYTYSDEIKVSLFSFAYQALKPWHEKVFFYLCMEEARFWHQVFGRCYDSNADFERDLGQKVMAKLACPAPGPQLI